MLLQAGLAANASQELALRFAAERRHEASAIEFRRLALAEGSAEVSGQWFWFAAHQYALDHRVELSNRMLDRGEDLAPFELSMPAGWLRAENAMTKQEWSSAVFYFESLQGKAETDDLRDFAARGAAAAHLRDGDGAAALQSVSSSPCDPSDALASLQGYARGSDKSPWLGGMLGILPGLGYAYSGEYANAARSLILNALFLWGMAEAAERDAWGLFAVAAFAEFTWYSGSIYGGIDAAHRHNQQRLDDATDGIRGPRRLKPDFAQMPLIVLNFEF